MGIITFPKRDFFMTASIYETEKAQEMSCYLNVYAAVAAESVQQQAGNLSERVSTFNVGDKAEIAQTISKKVLQEDREKKLAPVVMLKANKALTPKVPNNDEWESF